MSVSPDMVPVEPIEWPDRNSQTLMRHENQCPRSAYLYVLTQGAVKSHEMDRGTLAHACFERLTLERIIHDGDATGPMYVIDPNLPSDEQEPALSLQTAALVDEVARELEASGRVHISAEQADVARVCTFHVALADDVLPSQVLGVERKFVLDLPSGWEISVKADRLWTPEVAIAAVDDYKTSLYAPSDAEWSGFQVKVGALALLYGYPVERVPCMTCRGEGEINHGDESTSCPVCGGRGSIETRQERIGGSFQKVIGREIYPRLQLNKEGKLQHNYRQWTRLELDEFMADLDRAGARINARLESWVWPARKGSWCSECPLEAACPLPRELRDYQGAVRDRAHAQELWAWALGWKAKTAKVEAAVKAWAKSAEESVVVGDESWAWQQGEVTAVRKAGRSTDWDGLKEALRRSAELGERFDVKHWIKTSRRNDFKKTKIPQDQLTGEVTGNDAAGADDAGRGVDADERWGVDAPW